MVGHRAVSRIFLIGPMGGGKSTIGQPLAKALGYDFFDSDKEIERRTGVQIPLIFELEGEAGFRSRESDVLDEFTLRDNAVLATGGGAVISEQNRRCLRERGFVVYLWANIDQLVERTAKDKTRPILITANPREKIVELMQVRSPLYESIADLTLDTSETSIRDIVMGITLAIAS